MLRKRNKNKYPKRVGVQPGMAGRRLSKNLFPLKLYDMLADPELVEVISWMPHGRSWRVVGKDFFVTEVCPVHFNTLKFKSFIRLVNAWGFRRMTQDTPDLGSYFHPNFIRGRRDCIQQMDRPAPGKKDLSSKEPDFQDMPPMPPLRPEELTCVCPELRNQLAKAGVAAVAGGTVRVSSASAAGLMPALPPPVAAESQPSVAATFPNQQGVSPPEPNSSVPLPAVAEMPTSSLAGAHPPLAGAHPPPLDYATLIHLSGARSASKVAAAAATSPCVPWNIYPHHQPHYAPMPHPPWPPYPLGTPHASAGAFPPTTQVPPLGMHHPAMMTTDPYFQYLLHGGNAALPQVHPLADPSAMAPQTISAPVVAAATTQHMVPAPVGERPQKVKSALFTTTPAAAAAAAAGKLSVKSRQKRRREESTPEEFSTLEEISAPEEVSTWSYYPPMHGA